MVSGCIHTSMHGSMYQNILGMHGQAHAGVLWSMLIHTCKRCKVGMHVPYQLCCV